MKLQKNNKPVKIKNPKEFDIKFNNFIKALAISTTLLLISDISISAVLLNKLKPTDKKPTISQKYNNLDKHTKQENGITYYKGENILFGINRETLEIKKYLYYEEGSELYSIYDIETEELICYLEINGFFSKVYGIGYINYLKDTCEIFNLKNIEDENLKEWYALEDLDEIESKLLQPSVLEYIKKK